MTHAVLGTVRPAVNGEHSATLPASQERYTFPSSGITVTVNKVSQARTTDHRNSMWMRDEASGKLPVPPLQTVNIAGEDVTQANPADPDYMKALAAYTTAFNSREFEWFISKALSVDEEAVRVYREKSLVEDGTDYGEHPAWYIYLWHILALNADDYDGFQRVAWGMSRPTPAAIADAKARF